MTDHPTSRHTATTVDADGVATLEITDAAPLNLLGTEVIIDVTSTLTGLAGREDVRALVLRGAGDRAFVGGADIHEMVTLRRDTAEAFISRLAAMCEAVRCFPAPVIARVPGWCLGAGLEVAAACDLRIGSDDSRFGMPEVAVGIPSVIHAALLPGLVGAGRAGWLVLTGQSIDAGTALAWGLLDEICPPGELDDAVGAAARRFTALGPQVLRQQKRLLRSWADLPTDEAIRASVAEFGAAFDTGEPPRFMTDFLARKRRG